MGYDTTANKESKKRKPGARVHAPPSRAAARRRGRPTATRGAQRPRAAVAPAYAPP